MVLKTTSMTLQLIHLKHKIAIFSVCAFILIASFCLIGTLQLIDKLKKERESYIQHFMETSKSHIEQKLVFNVGSISSILRDISIANTHFTNVNNFLNSLSNDYRYIRSFAIFNNKGTMLSSNMSKALLKDMNDNSYITKHLESKKSTLYISDPFTSNLIENNFFAVSLASRNAQTQAVESITLAIIDTGVFKYLLKEEKGLNLALISKKTLKPYYVGNGVKEFNQASIVSGLPFLLVIQPDFTHPRYQQLLFEIDNVNKNIIHIIIGSCIVGFIVLIMALIILNQSRLKSRFNEELERTKAYDNLTNTFNRNHIFVELEKSKENQIQYGELFSILLLDLDNFKFLCHEQGYKVCDTVLKQLSTLLEEECNENEVIGRYSSNTFLILLERTNYEKAQKFAEHLRKKIELMPLKTPLGVRHITASFGVLEHQSCNSLSTNLKKLEKALDAAKKVGKNKVIVVDG